MLGLHRFCPDLSVHEITKPPESYTESMSSRCSAGNLIWKTVDYFPYQVDTAEICHVETENQAVWRARKVQSGHSRNKTQIIYTH